MRRDPAFDPISKIAVLVRAQKDGLLARWREQVCKLPSARQLDEPQLTDHVPQLIDELKKAGRDDITVVVGGVIPAQDYDFLKAAGVEAIYGPGTNIPEAASDLMDILKRRHNMRKSA